MNGAYTPNGFATTTWNNAGDRSSSAPPGGLGHPHQQPRRGRPRTRRHQNGQSGTGAAVSSAAATGYIESDDGISDRDADTGEVDDGVQKELAARQKRQEELRVRMAEYQAKRREEMEGKEKREAEELQRKIAAEEADPVLRSRRAKAIDEHREWERRLLQMPPNQAWTEVKDTQEQRVMRWQELKLMGGVEYRPTRGLCESMCSASEIVERIATMDVMHPERDPNTGQPDPARFVKRYKRVEPVIIPTDVRTPAALMRTTGYLLEILLNRGNYGEVYGFVEDRCRAVMKDYSVQRISDAPAMEVHERIARFYAFSTYFMYDTYRPIQAKQDENVKLAVPASGYNPTLNKQQLDKDLLTLKNLYVDNHTVQGNDRRRNPHADLFPHEAEMTSYRLISDYVEYRIDFRKYAVAKRDWDKLQAGSTNIDYSSMPRDPGPPQLRWDYAVRMTPWMFLASDLIDCAKGGNVAAPPPVTTCRYKKIAAEVRFFDLLMLPSTPPLFAALFIEEFGWLRVQAIEKLLGGKPGFVKASTLVELLKFDSEEQVAELARACGLTVVPGADGAVRVGWRSGDALNFVDPTLPRQGSQRVFQGKFPDTLDTAQITAGQMARLESFDGYPQLELQPYYEVVKSLLNSESNPTSESGGTAGWLFSGERAGLVAPVFGDGDPMSDADEIMADYQMDTEERGETMEEGGMGDGEDGEYEEEDGGDYEEGQDAAPEEQHGETASAAGLGSSLLVRLGAEPSKARTSTSSTSLNPTAQPFVPGSFGITPPQASSLFSSQGTAQNPLFPSFPQASDITKRVPTNTAAPEAGTDKQALFTKTFGSLFRPAESTATHPKTVTQQDQPSPAGRTFTQTSNQAPRLNGSAFAKFAPGNAAQQSSATGLPVLSTSDPSVTLTEPKAITQGPSFGSFASQPSLLPPPTTQPVPAKPTASTPIRGVQPFGLPVYSNDGALTGVRALSDAFTPLQHTNTSIFGAFAAPRPTQPLSWPVKVAESQISAPIVSFPADTTSDLSQGSPIVKVTSPRAFQAAQSAGPITLPLETQTDRPNPSKPKPDTAIGPVAMEKTEEPMKVDAGSTAVSPRAEMSVIEDERQLSGDPEENEAIESRSSRHMSIGEALQVGLGNPALNAGFSVGRGRRMPKFNDTEEAERRRQLEETAKKFDAPDTMRALLRRTLERDRHAVGRPDPIRGFQTWVVPSEPTSKHAHWLASKFGTHQSGSTRAGHSILRGFVERSSEGIVPPSPGLIVFECSSHIQPDNFSSAACRADRARLLDVLDTIPDVQSYFPAVLVIVHGEFFPGSAGLIHRNLGLESLPRSVQDTSVITLKDEYHWVPEIEKAITAVKLDAIGRPIQSTSAIECIDALVKEWRKRLWEALPETPGTDVVAPMFSAFVAGVDTASSQVWRLTVQSDEPNPLELPAWNNDSSPTWKAAIEAVDLYLRLPFFQHSSAITAARQRLQTFASEVSRFPNTYGIELFQLSEYIGDHVLDIIKKGDVRPIFKDEYLGRDLLSRLEKAVRPGWASAVAEFKLVCENLPKPPETVSASKRDREEADTSVEDNVTNTPKRPKTQHVEIPTNGRSTPTPSARDGSTPPKRGTLHSLRARIKAANALSSGEPYLGN